MRLGKSLSKRGRHFYGMRSPCRLFWQPITLIKGPGQIPRSSQTTKRCKISALTHKVRLKHTAFFDALPSDRLNPPHLCTDQFDVINFTMVARILRLKGTALRQHI